MRKKLDTRFPAARIKKIMQSDEDVGKIAMAVPLLVSKALELFLQDLCDRTYEITLKRGAKTLNSSHLKQCVQKFSVFDFLRDTVGKVPDLGGSDNVSEDRPASVIKRRRIVGDEENGSNIELKKAQMIEAGHPTSGVRGRGRGRGRPRGRRARSPERDSAGLNEKTEDDQDGPMPEIGDPDSDGTNGMIAENKSKQNPSAHARNFDLNADLDENGDLKDELDAPPGSLGAETDYEMKHEEIQGWSVEKIAINPMQLTGLNGIMEDDEDYDEES